MAGGRAADGSGKKAKDTSRAVADGQAVGECQPGCIVQCDGKTSEISRSAEQLRSRTIKNGGPLPRREGRLVVGAIAVDIDRPVVAIAGGGGVGKISRGPDGGAADDV